VDLGLVGSVGLVGLVGSVGLVSSVGLVGLVGLVGPVSLVGLVGLVGDWSSKEFLFFFLAYTEPLLDFVEDSSLVGLVGFIVAVVVGVVGLVVEMGVVASVALVVEVVAVVALVVVAVGAVSESSHNVFSFIETSSDIGGDILGLVPERSILIDDQRVWPGEVEWLHCAINKTTCVALRVISKAEFADLL
jgi:hypothetical protein